MERIGKGKSIENHVEDYSVVDIETTGCNLYADSIIEISAIKVRTGKVIDEFSSLVNPHCCIPLEASRVNGITNDMVETAPDITEVIGQFIDFIKGDIVVGYNNSTFDMLFLYDVLMRTKNIVFSNDYIDVMHVARRCLHNIENYKLETICKSFGLDTKGEHRALKDCYLTKDCYDRIYSEYGETPFKPLNNKKEFYLPKYTGETIELRNLHKLIEDVIYDDNIDEDEISDIRQWIEKHSYLSGNYDYDRIKKALSTIVESRNDELSGKEAFKNVLNQFVDPLINSQQLSLETDIHGKHICVTGEFDYGDRESIFELIESIGGEIDKNIKKTTDFVVVGAKGSDGWKLGNYGGKIQKAKQYNDKGANIQIIRERDFISFIKEKRISLISKEYSSYGEISWEEKTQKMLIGIIKQYELPEKSLFLAENKKEDGSISSYSICIWEPDYPLTKEIPNKNYTVINITPSKVQSRPNELNLVLSEEQERIMRPSLPEDAEILEKNKSDIENKKTRIRINKHSTGLLDYLKHNTEYCIQNYKSKESRFGCCSRYEECSNMGRCIHVNQLYSKACMYRKNLENGRVYYGKTIMISENKVYYQGGKEISETDKEIRRQIGLPVTKQLVYYTDKKDANSAVNVVCYRLIKEYNLSEHWYTMEIQTENGLTLRINSLYFVEMQKASFISDMANQSF